MIFTQSTLSGIAGIKGANLIALCNGAEASGTTLYNFAQQGQGNGSISGAQLLYGASPTGDNTFYCDGVTDYMSVKNCVDGKMNWDECTVSFLCKFPAAAFGTTLMYWLFFEDSTSSDRIWIRSNNTANSWTVRRAIDPAGFDGANFTFSSPGSVYTNMTYTFSLSNNRWALYINGTSTASGTLANGGASAGSTSCNASTGVFYASSNLGANAAEGTGSWMMVWNAELSSAQVQLLSDIVRGGT